METYPERAEINNWWKRRLVWSAIGLTAWLGGAEAKQHTPASGNMWGAADTVEWAGQTVTLINGALLTFGGVAVELCYNEGKKSREKLSKLKTRLPLLQGDPTSRDVRQSWNRVVDYEVVIRRESYLADIKYSLTNPYLSQVGFYEALDCAADNLAHKLHKAFTSPDEDRHGRLITGVMWAGQFLDQALPISLDCPNTPHAEDDEQQGHKHWYEFILMRQQMLEDSKTAVVS